MLQESSTETATPAVPDRVPRWQRVHRRLQRITKKRGELDAEEATLLCEAEAMKIWRELGYATFLEYLEREMGHPPLLGAERRRVARALRELPAIAAGMQDGSLTYSAVRKLVRVADRPTDTAWLEAARGKTVRQVEELVAGHKHGDLPEDPTDPDIRPRKLAFEVGPDTMAQWRSLRGALDEEFGEHLDDDQLIQLLCRRARETAENATARPAYQMAITTCRECKRSWENGAGVDHEVPPAVVERATCDAEHLGSFQADPPERVTSTVTPRMRRQVFARDGYKCTIDGCRSSRNLDIHHITYQGRGGRHQLWNLTTVCSGHHQRLHDGKLLVRGRAPDALVFDWSHADQPARGAPGRGS